MHRFQVDGLSHELRVIRFDGQEGLSQLYQFDISVASPDKDIAFDDVIGRDATLTFHVGDTPRVVHGMVSRFEQGEEGKKLTSYRATLVPRVFRLKHRRQSRIFQQLSVPDIILKVLQKAGIAGDLHRFALKHAYRTREYCVQYRESDWDFLSRLMEEEGIGYYFEHDEGKHVLVMGDSPSAHGPIAGDAAVLFRTPTGALTGGECISSLRVAQAVRPGKVTLRDYNWKKPGLSLEASADAPDDDDIEIYDYPGDYDVPGAGKDLSKIRLEQLQVRRKTSAGTSVCPRLVPGSTFKLSDHPRDDFNAEYLVVRVEHHGSEPHMEQSGGHDDAPYGNHFEAIPSSVPFRPPQVTPRPTVKGVQTAIVVGPSGEEIFTDEHGRVKVHFHWDREGKRDEHSSCWIRVSQIWSGPGWGALFIPRVGHEVVVDFIEGDPDRPLVVGSVYHGANVPPYSLPADRTKSTIKSNSSTGGNGFNELRFEDKKGSEEVYLRGQKDWTIEIKNDKRQTIGHDESLEVVNDREKVIGGDQSEDITGKKTTTVGEGHTEKIGEDSEVEIGENRSVKVGADDKLEITGDRNVKIDKGLSIAVKESKSETVGKSSSETIDADKTSKIKGMYDVSVGKAMKLTIEKDFDEDVKESKTIIVGKKLSIECGDSKISIDKEGKITVEGKDITVKCDGPVKVQGKKLDVKSDGAVNVEASGKIKLKGSKVGMN